MRLSFVLNGYKQKDWEETKDFPRSFVYGGVIYLRGVITLNNFTVD